MAPNEYSQRRALSWTRLSCLLFAGAVFIASTVFWIRSPNHFDYARYDGPTRYYLIVTVPHGVRFSTWTHAKDKTRFQFASYVYDVRNAYGIAVVRPATDWSKLGFDLKSIHFSNKAMPEPGAFELYIPFWFILLVLALQIYLIAVAWIRKMRRRNRNLCAACGYDIRATPDRCPECGTAPLSVEGQTAPKPI